MSYPYIVISYLYLVMPYPYIVMCYPYIVMSRCFNFRLTANNTCPTTRLYEQQVLVKFHKLWTFSRKYTR